MDIETPERAMQDACARRARAVIIVLMAVFIAAPVVLWLLAAGGTPQSP
jgi:hypothetical protein